MSTSRKILGLSAVSVTLLVVAVLVVLNLVSTRFFGRADLTEGKIYSLSEASRQVAADLQDPLIARVYLSPDLPPQLLTVRQYLLDLLSEYRAYGKGRFQYEIVSPATDEEENEAQSYGVQPFQANVYQADKVELKRIYLGLVFIHADRQEALAAVTSTEGLEFQLTSAMRRVTRQSLGNVGVVAATGGPTLSEGLSALQQLVSREYRIREVDLTASPMPADITALMVVGPRQNLSDTVLWRIDQYIMRGGPVMFLLDGGEANLQASPQQGGGLAFPIATNVDSLALHYGAAPRPEYVMDQRHNQVQAMQNLGFLQIPVAIPYPLFVQGSSGGTDHLLGKELDRVDMLFVSPLEVKPAPEVKATVVVQSSSRSGTRKLPTMVMPPLEETPTDYTSPGQPLAVALEGTFRSYWSDSALGSTPPYGPIQDTSFLGTSADARLLVVGDADLVGDQGLGRNQFNQVFVLNALDWLSRNDLLIALRSRQVEDRPLEALDPGARSRVKWANLLGPSLLVIVVGLYRWRRRSRAQHRTEQP
jgi:gliding-associated putative ABC transporter substrate-binding component GldG